MITELRPDFWSALSQNRNQRAQALTFCLLFLKAVITKLKERFSAYFVTKKWSHSSVTNFDQLCLRAVITELKDWIVFLVSKKWSVSSEKIFDQLCLINEIKEINQALTFYLLSLKAVITKLSNHFWSALSLIVVITELKDWFSAYFVTKKWSVSSGRN